MTILFLFSVAVLRIPWQRKFERYRFQWLTIPSYSLQKCQGCRNWNRWSYHIHREAQRANEINAGVPVLNCPFHSPGTQPRNDPPTVATSSHLSYAIKIIPTGMPRGQSSSRFCQVDNQHWPHHVESNFCKSDWTVREPLATPPQLPLFGISDLATEEVKTWRRLINALHRWTKNSW